MSDRTWEQAYLNDLREYAAKVKSLFSNARKPEREQMVARAFLRCAGVSFSEQEIQAGREEPVDVTFRDAAFQVTVLLGGRMPHKEWQEKEKKWQAAQTAEDVEEPPTVGKPMTVRGAANALADELQKKAQHYADRSKIDLVAISRYS